MSATPFVLNSDVFGTNDRNRNYDRTFDLGPVPPIDGRNLYVTLRAVGTNLFNGVAPYGGTLGDPAYATAINNAGFGNGAFDRGAGRGVMTGMNDELARRR